MRITVAWSPAAGQAIEKEIALPDGSSVADACGMAGTDSLEVVAGSGAALSIWGRRCAPDRLLRDGDRVEVTRALRIDPKEARRLRFDRQGRRAAGLFANKKAGEITGSEP